MASTKTSLVTTQLVQRDVQHELTLSTISDDQIMNQTLATTNIAVEKFDTDSLFVVAENILKRTTNIVENVVRGTHAHQENLEEKTPKASFSPPLCILKQLSSEMACTAPGEEIARKTTISILNKLSGYSWDAKAVLTLASFALEYGDFWLLAQLHSSDQLAKSVGILKRVPAILKSQRLQKFGKAIVELHSLVKATSEVIEHIVELEKLSIHDIKDVPALSDAIDRIPDNVYWAITTIVACTSQMSSLTLNEDKTHELSCYAQKINIILESLRTQIKRCNQQKEEVEAYWKLKRLLRAPTEIIGVLKALIFPEDNVQLLIDGSTHKSVRVDVLQKKNVLLLISDLNISIDELSILKSIYEGIRKEENYKIVWVPIVEHRTDVQENKFEMMQSIMPWYIVRNFSSSIGMKFIKEEWNFKNGPLLVAMSPQGKVEHSNAFHMIRLWGMQAFPFTALKENELLTQGDVMGAILSKINPNINVWIKEEKYIFFYGGKDKEWIQQFEKKATALVNDSVIKNANIRIELFCVGMDNKGEADLSILGHFWSGIESFFFCKTHRKTEPDRLTQEIQKLLSYKNENGWVVLNKGSRVVVSVLGQTILNVLDEFEKWKANMREIGFELSFKEYLDMILETTRRRYSFDIPITAGNISEHLKYSDCPRIMETNVSFKFSQNDAAFKALL